MKQQDDGATERDKIERELGLAAGFTSRLFEEDDWSFIIKSSALIETTINQVVAEYLRHPGVTERIARLPLPQRLQILQAYEPDALSAAELRAVGAVSELRNRLAHNVRNTEFTFTTFFGDVEKRTKFYNDVRAASSENERKSLDAEFAHMGDAAIKVATWLGVYTVAMKLVTDLQARRDFRPNYKGALIAALMKGTETGAHDRSDLLRYRVGRCGFASSEPIPATMAGTEGDADLTKTETKLQGDPYRGRDPREIPAYTTLEAARYLRIPERTLRNWAFGYTYRLKTASGHMQALIRVAGGDRNLLSFTNLAELHVLDGLRRVHELKMKRIRRTLLYIGREFQTDHPLVHQEMWTDGLNLFLEHYGHLVNASQEGQLAMRDLVTAHLQRIDRDLTGIIRLFPLTRKRPALAGQIVEEPRIVAIDPTVAFGRPSIRGSRIPTVEIAERFKAGESLQDLSVDFRRSIEEIEEAVRIELDLEAA